MHGISPLIATEAVLIMAWRFALVLSPFFAVLGLWTLVNQTDRIIHYLFPNLQWEHDLGWLNIKAERRARRAVRWLGYSAYVALLFALGGIVWAAVGLQSLDHWPDPWVVGDLMLRVPVLIVSIGVWVLYLGSWLMPKIRREHEEIELQKFRKEAEELEREREMYPRSRVHSALPKPRKNSPSGSLAVNRMGRRR